MKKKYSHFLIFLFAFNFLAAQNVTQTVRGTIRDKESGQPLEGVSVAVVKDSLVTTGAVTDEKGVFHLEKVIVGRVNISASYLGYKKVYMPNIMVNSGKETVLNIEMESAIETKNEVVVTAAKKGEAINEMAVLSARAFSVEEAERYAGSRGDPARMAACYAGVSGTDDSRNDLVVRGNSPFGMMYRIDGISVPNPNHFALEGTAGGSVAILSDRMLATSDFLTGAFPAEYGNATAGVFDIRFKNGNDERQEFTASVGMLGAEVFGEGPIGKNSDASYIFNYRYATLEALVKLGVNIGTTAIPKYQDFQFKLNFPLKSKRDNISLFGIGGYAGIYFPNSDETRPPSGQDIYAGENTNELYHSGLGVAGLTWTHRVSDNEYSKLTLGICTEYNFDSIARLIRHVNSAGYYVLDTMYNQQDYKFAPTRYTLNYIRNKKLSARSALRYGILNELFQPIYHFQELLEPYLNPGLSNYEWQTKLNAKNQVHLLTQPYAQWKYALAENVTMVTGLHGQFFSLSKSWSLEPRFSIKWQMRPNQSLSFGTGLYSQMLPFYQYFVMDTNGIQNNRHLDFIRSYQAVLGYDVFFKKDIHIKVEGYFQQLFNIPVDTFKSSYNVLDEGTGFDLFFPGKLVNKGLGRNMGLELTMEKYFTHNWFIMFTGSVYDSRLQGSNGQWYNSDFNSHYIFNLMGTKEFKWGTKRLNTIGLGAKIMFGGGLRYTPYDTTLSKTQENPVVIDSLRDKYEFRPYFRLDLKLSYKCNTKRFTHEVGIDLVNATNYQNILRVEYISPQDPNHLVYQLGFLPLFYYRLDFWIGKKNW